MILKKINFFEYRGKSNYWEIKDVNLGRINLIVGRNATGKTRLLNIISNLAKILTKKAKYLNGHWDLEFLDEKQKIIYIYNLEISQGIIKKEKITKNRKILLDREGGDGEIYSNTQKKLIAFAPPEEELTLHSRRDRKEHPFQEKIYNWANSFYGYAFSNISANQITVPNPERPDDMLENLGTVPYLLAEAIRKNPEVLKNLMSDFSKVGYSAKAISIVKTILPGVAVGVPLLALQEVDLKCKTHQLAMSQGMYRAISLIIIIEHILMKYKHCSIAIDDLGEGLDYDRSVKLKNLLFKKIHKSDIQLIATSNDRFLINAIDLKYINLLERKGHVVSAFNYANSKKKFEEFKFTGLNTFDFFARKIYKEKID